ncbi:hypothetical protein ACS0TY_029916 [Phlomoides rotata]
MATAPTVSIQWIPEDDLLLKNAVEAGASLEALAKGAIQFSRRYTYQELYQRWNSLLHDPDISTEAAARIFELEISGFNPAPKLNRSEINFTGNKEVSKKRKFESIRRKYYAMRKKIRNELFSNSDLGFFEPNPHEFSGHGADFQKQVMHDDNSLGQHSMIRDDLSDHLGLQEEDLDILRHAFPGTIRDIAVSSGATNVSRTGCPNFIEENCQNRTMGSYRFNGNVASSLDGGTNNLEVNILNREGPLSLRKNPINENPHNSSVGFEGREQLDSSNSGAFSSFQAVVFAPTQSHLRHLRTMQHVTAPPLPVSMNMQDTAQVAIEMIHNDVEGKENNSAAYSGEFADPDSLLNLSNEDEILLVDEDENWPANKGCIDDIDSVIKDSNQDGKENEIPKPELETVAASEASSAPATSVNPVAFEVAASSVHGDQQMNCQPEVNPVAFEEAASSVHGDQQMNYRPEVNPVAFEVAASSVHGEQQMNCQPEVNPVAFEEAASSVHGDQQMNCQPEVNPVAFEVAASSVHGEQQMNCQVEIDMHSKPTLDSDIPRLSDGQICCTLNTEDTEIPCNDDIFLLIHPSASFGSSAPQPNTTGFMSSAAHEKRREQALCLPAKAKDSIKDCVWPHAEGIHSLPESRAVHPLVGHASKTESLNSRPQALLPGFANKAIGDSSKGGSLYALPTVCGNILAKKEVAGVGMKVGDNPARVTEIIQSIEAGSSRSQRPESVENVSVSDPEESDINDDVPYFSDIEAMILEMDLDPYDQDNQFIRQVPSYQHDDTKRTIIRLEQGARSCLERAMTSQGALAILYGRHLRHYIRKPEVLLGRSTDDVIVDIDLRKEGRANKISRRQAIIKMEADGSFVLKNLGKSSVCVNGEPVGSGQLLTLSSSCLIEVISLVSYRLKKILFILKNFVIRHN